MIRGDVLRPTALRVESAPVALVLFLCLFAAQSAVIVMAPLLAEAAADLDVSTSTAGQLRTITGLVAGVTALLSGAIVRRVSLEWQLLAAVTLLAAGSGASALAPSYTVLALAQVPVGAAVALLTTAAVVAAAEWSPPERRTAALSWVLIGQPAAWVLGMPLLGIVGERSWRLGWLVLPLAASVAVSYPMLRRAARQSTRAPVPDARAVLADPGLKRWLLGELFANAGWAGTLVYSGALFAETYGTSPRATGLLLAIGAAAYVAGNLSSRGPAREPSTQRLALLALGLVLAVGLLGLARSGVAVSLLSFSAAAYVAGARTLVTSAFALTAAPALRASLASLRAATMQFGYFLGSIAGGLALDAGGYGGIGVTMSVFFLLAAAALTVTACTPLTRARCGCAPA